MLQNKNILKGSLVVIILLLVMFIDGDLFAQITLPNDGTVNDEPAAPIDGFIGVGIAIGSYLGYRKLKKK